MLSVKLLHLPKNQQTTAIIFPKTTTEAKRLLVAVTVELYETQLQPSLNAVTCHLATLERRWQDVGTK